MRVQNFTEQGAPCPSLCKQNNALGKVWVRGESRTSILTEVLTVRADPTPLASQKIRHSFFRMSRVHILLAVSQNRSITLSESLSLSMSIVFTLYVLTPSALHVSEHLARIIRSANDLQEHLRLLLVQEDLSFRAAQLLECRNGMKTRREVQWLVPRST